MKPLDHELSQERTYHDTCRAAMASMVEESAEQVVIGEDVSASGADAEALGYTLRSRAKALLEEPDRPLFFGRLSFEDSLQAGDHRRQTYYIGRRRLSEHPSTPPLVVDWRAPVSSTFYQASAKDPQGVAVRRRFGWAAGSRGASEDLSGMEDEHLTAGESGESQIVASEIERPRVGPMRDIAATIQPEQDDLVRSQLTDSVCVQGAPGTGKTAVGLHRAAYLLYTYPQRIQRSGLLIIGPNRTFLKYISEVLPSLGEIDIRQCMIADEIARHPVQAQDAEAAAAVKHDSRMAQVLRQALYARVGSPSESVAVPDGSYRWRISVEELEEIVAEVREEAPLYAVGRERVRARAVQVLQRQVERRAGPPNNEWLRKMGRAKPISAFVDSVWRKVQPEEVVASVLSDPDILTVAADGILSADEQKAILWPKPPRSWKSAKWSEADLVLIDEVAGLIERPEGYGHVVVDEAQDLSPMQCRVIGRRVDFGSVTVLGDLAQGTTPWAARNWPEQLVHLGKQDAQVVPLTMGFRVPAKVVEFANRLIGSLDVDVPPSRSLRRDGELMIRNVPDTVKATIEVVRAALEGEGSIGVIADAPEVMSLRDALADAGIETSTSDDTGSRVTVLPAEVAKGLEYDHVVVVEPAAIVEAETRGLHRLYVVLTRAVSRLDVIHRRPLPMALDPA
ncbi:ATPase AAA [Streptomyces lacrimifluminis]|uniref:DNA helicase n=2 Tax=Streptomyces lacrimifluminis TaxID=1500077 RepID=A0A917UNW2_9ACTN|nr:DNA helicase [Streptomyces lacrimifluminis]